MSTRKANQANKSGRVVHVPDLGDIVYVDHKPTPRRRQLEPQRIFFALNLVQHRRLDDRLKDLFRTGARLYDRVIKDSIAFNRSQSGGHQMALTVNMTTAEANSDFVDKAAKAIMEVLSAHLKVQLDLMDQNSGSPQESPALRTVPAELRDPFQRNQI